MNNPFGHQLYNWHLEVSSKCPLKCPRCLRQLYPGTYENKELSVHFVKKNFNQELLKKHVLRITFGGGVGDAIYCSEFLEIVKYLKTTHPDFQMVLVTNGGHRTEKFWHELSNIVGKWDEIIFSIDGKDNTQNSLYRQNSDWKGTMKAINIMVKSPATIRWQCIIFKFNQNHLEEIKNLAENNGVDQFHLTKSYLFGSKISEYIDPNLLYDPLEPDAEFISSFIRTQRMKYTFNNNPKKILDRGEFFKIFNPVAENYEKLAREKFKNYFIMPTCRFGFRGSYIDYLGIYYPCSWVSHYFDKMTSRNPPHRTLEFKDYFWEKNREKFNLHKRTLEKILDDPIWNTIDNDWKSIDTMALVCERKCLQEETSHEKLITKKVEM